MASLREEARAVIDVARDAIIWIAVWKTGRSWHCREIYSVDYQESNPYFHRDEKWQIDEDDKEELRDILKEDPNACLVNGYYMNIGSLEEMTIESLADGLRYQYEISGNMESILRKAG